MLKGHRAVLVLKGLRANQSLAQLVRMAPEMGLRAVLVLKDLRAVLVHRGLRAVLVLKVLVLKVHRAKQVPKVRALKDLRAVLVLKAAQALRAV